MTERVPVRLEHAVGGKQPEDAAQRVRVRTGGVGQLSDPHWPILERVRHPDLGHDVERPRQDIAAGDLLNGGEG
jgi:hypothetical protein